jgi:LAO/AO transport system kinase
VAAPPDTLAERVLARDPRAVARAISLVEDGEAEGAALIQQIFQRTGGAFLVGITGVPGGGKSTLVDRLIATIRATGKTVGVLAVDPSSPFSGGAVLGDRVRMNAHAADRGVFVRSMATRGHLGGLARTTSDAALVLDAAGFDVVLIETVGVGQDEVDVAQAADATVVVLVPGTGDDVQAIKAGIMEIADLFVINKADLDGAEKLEREIKMAQNAHVPVLLTSAQEGKGVAEALAAARQCQKRPDPALWAIRLREMLRERLLEQFPQEMFETAAQEVAAKIHDPYTVIDQWLERFHQHK